MSVIELVVFDMAGTTVLDRDNVAGALVAALAEAAVAVDVAQVNAVMGWPKPDAIRHLLGGKNGDVEAIHRDFVGRMIRYYRTDPEVGEVPGASAVFRWLRNRGVKIALDTGFSRPIAEAIVTRLGFASKIDVLVTSDEVLHGRPAPDLIHLAMKRAEVTDASAVAKVGDTPSDLQQGRAAGCGLVVGVTRGSHTAEQLAKHPHDLLVPTVASLPGVLLGNVRRRVA
ncbi:MAG: HAD family hydrolase [Polyangiales bacterium]